MATKRNNEIKEFAIGTKIEYNGKLYEVVEELFCDNCSIANICTNAEFTNIKKSDNLLSREQRYSIFGECSNFNRADGTSIVFKEVPMTKSNNNNINHNIIQPLVESDGTVKDLQIKAPTNYKIDVEASDLDKGIIRFKNKWLSLEQLYRLAKENNHTTYRDSIKNLNDDKLLALANLMDIARYFNGNWKYDVTKESVGYMIVYDKFASEPHYSVRENFASVNSYYGNPVFKNEADALYVIDNPNFRNLLYKIFRL